MARPLTKKQKEAILAKLEETYKDTKTALNYNSPFELLVAVILSAQCTDERVNVITSRIFPRLNTPEKMGALTQEQMEAAFSKALRVTFVGSTMPEGIMSQYSAV